MNRVLLSITAAIAFASAGVARAADLPVKAPPPAPAPVVTWTGCYVAGGFGYGVASIDHTARGPTGATFDIGHDNGAKGWLATVGVGCDYQFASSWTIGVFGDFDWSNIKGTLSYNCPTGCVGPTGFAGDGTFRNAWYAGGRIGYVPFPQLLGYFSAGVTQMRLSDVTYIDASGTTGDSTSVGAQTFNGWFIGGGTEYRLNWWPGLALRSEYRFAQYEARDGTAVCVTGAGCGGTGVTHAIVNLSPTVQTVRTELVWRFGAR